MVRAAAAGVGNAVVLMGASTGRDGIGGASVLASAELEEGDDSKRPTVQIGDPFEESKLLECCLELLGAGLLVSLQDLGAAGLTSSAGEMASAGGVGIDIDVGRVPLREADMEPFEIMVSESQERMLAVVEPAKVDEVIAVCERWQTGAAAIGEVTDSAHVPRPRGGEVVGDMPVAALVDECPLYDLDARRARGLDLREQRPPASDERAPPADPGSRAAEGRAIASWRCSASPSVASKRWAFEQYDSIVGSRTVRRPEAADAAVLQLPEAGDGDRGLDRRQRPPRRLRPVRGHDRGGARVRAEPRLRRRRAARPHQLPQLRQPREAGTSPGSSTARPRASPTPATALGMPVVGGNVSLYNETEDGPIYPTPVVGMVGELPDAERAGGSRSRDGDAIALVGPFAPSLAGSELAKLRGELGPGLPGVADRRRRARRSRSSARRSAPGASRAAHDVSDGGLACALAEMAIAGGVGARGRPRRAGRARGCSGETALFGEGPGRLRARRRRAPSSSALAAEPGVDVLDRRRGRRRADRDLRRGGEVDVLGRRRARLALARERSPRVSLRAEHARRAAHPAGRATPRC